MKFEKLSPKQAEIFKFPHESYDALICDGAVRSGKTMMMTYAFVWWAMEIFNGAIFAICGKTVQSAERNIIHPLLETKSITDRYAITYTRSMKLLTIRRGGATNYFYIFGGKDESSYMLIQGLTLSGVLLDEVALMPQSFVEQAITRTLSVDNAKLWFNCNPENPMHWFYTDWILKAEAHNAKHIHFLMTDNPGLSERAIERAERDFAGVFYERYVLGRWVVAEGIIYPMFNKERHIVCSIPGGPGRYYLSIDYGTVNAFAAGLWKIVGGKSYKEREYYHDARKEGQRKTDEEYYADIDALVGSTPLEYIVIDPSAASLIECVRRHGRYRIRGARNDVVNGIRTVSSLLQTDRVFYHESCKDTINEFALYRWDDKARGDVPLKENDHAMDSDRYYAYTVLCDELGFVNWPTIKGR